MAILLTTLLRSAREVISDQQDLINEPKPGKDLTAKRVIEMAKAKYAAETGHPLPMLDPSSSEGKMIRAELDAIDEVMDQAQPLINDPNRGFKGFVPAIFTYRVSDAFSRKVGDLAYLKLTAPEELIRHSGNAPDTWENRIIKTKFQSGMSQKGKVVAEVAELYGHSAYRVLIPEYYDASCLACHGGPQRVNRCDRRHQGGRQAGRSRRCN